MAFQEEYTRAVRAAVYAFEDDGAMQGATLKSLSVDPGRLSPGFSAPRKAYTVYVPHSVDGIRVRAEAAEAGDVLKVNGEVAEQGGAGLELAVGRNPVAVTVGSADRENTYLVKVIRAPARPDWERVAERNDWIPRDSTGEMVFRDRMWLMGGFRAEPTWNNFDDVWYSSDGATWNRLETDSVWTARHEYAA